MDWYCMNLNKKCKWFDIYYFNKFFFVILVIKCLEDILNGWLSFDCVFYFGNKCIFMCNLGFIM